MTKQVSPIEKMIDQACKHQPEDTGWPEPRDAESHDEQVAMGISQSVVNHIEDMYPEMFKSAPSTARTSIGNHTYNAVLFELRHYPANTDLSHEPAKRRPNYD